MSEAPVEVKTSWWEDLVDVYIAPRAVFARRAPDAKFGMFLLSLVIGIVVLYYLTLTAMRPVYEADFERTVRAAVAANPAITREQMLAGLKIQLAVGGAVAGVVVALATVFLALNVWILGKAADARLSFRQGMLISCIAFFPRLAEFILSGAQALVLPESSITGRFSVSLGVGRFLDPNTTAPILLGFLARIDLITIWVTFLIWLGFQVVGKAKRGPAAAAALGVWLVGALPALVQGALTK